jgi:hypothetical protein
MDDVIPVPPSAPATFTNTGPLTVALLVLSVLVSGCAKDAGCLVTGQVTLDGTPLSEGLVMFRPFGDDPSLKTVSTVINNGQFTFEPAKKLMPGKYRVAITSEQTSGKKIEADLGTGVMIEEFVQVIPPKYNAESKLEVDIAGDRDDLVFELTRK